MSATVIPDLKKLSPAEKLSLVGALWDEIAATAPEVIGLTAQQKLELESRLADFKKIPAEGAPWAEVKRRILGKQ